MSLRAIARHTGWLGLTLVIALLLALPVASALAQDTGQAEPAATEAAPAAETPPPAEEPPATEAVPAEAAPAEAAPAAESAPATEEAAPEAAPANGQNAADAAEDLYSDATGVPRDRFCVRGSVIDHTEQPLTGGWNIVARPLGPDGVPNPDSSILQVSDANGQFVFDNLGLGTWEFLIELQPGWEGVTPESFTVTLEYGEHKCIEVRFKLRRVIEVVVQKVDDAYVPLEGWTIRAEPGEDNHFAVAYEQRTNSNGIATFYLTEGDWVFTEKAPEDTKYYPIIPESGVSFLEVEWPGPYYLTFKNRLHFKGCIEVVKYDRPPNGRPIPIPGWKIDVLRMDWSVADSDYTDAQGIVEFENLPLGPYVVVEEERAGWEPISPMKVEVQLTDNRCVRVVFENRQVPPTFCIEGYKIDTNGEVGIPGWRIYAKPLDKGGYVPEIPTVPADVQAPEAQAPDAGAAMYGGDGSGKHGRPWTVYTDGEGKYRFDFPLNDYRIPGSRYEICEEVRDGWLPHTPTCYTVILPQYPGECVDVPDFENQQVGHGEEDDKGHGKEDGKGYNGEDGKGYHKDDGHAYCRDYHSVKRGESLYGIGNRYGVSPSEMVKANPWVRERPHYYLYINDKVCIP
jgi:hypothetical protein